MANNVPTIDAGKIVVGVSTLKLLNPGNATGVWRDVGSTDDGFTVSVDLSTVEIKIEEKVDPVDEITNARSAKVSGNLAEISFVNMHASFPQSVHDTTNNVLIIGGDDDSPDPKRLQAIIISKNDAGFNRTWLLGSVVPVSSGEQSFKQDEKTMIPIELKALLPNGTDNNMVIEGSFPTDLDEWTVGAAGFAWTSANVVGVTAADTLTQTMVELKPGFKYVAEFTISAWTTGDMTISVGGTSGTTRSAAGSFREVIIAAATQDVILTSANTPVMDIGTVEVYPGAVLQIHDATS